MLFAGGFETLGGHRTRAKATAHRIATTDATRAGAQRKAGAAAAKRGAGTAGETRANSDPGTDKTGTTNTTGKAGPADEIAETLGLLPEIKGCVEIFAATQIAFAGGEIGLEAEARKAVEHRPLFGDPPIDDVHVVVGRKRKTVLHRDHLLTGSSQATIVPFSAAWMLM